MKIKFPISYFFIFSLLISVWVLFFFTKCSDAKQAQQGYKKFIKHGGKVDSDTTYITVTDIVKGKDGKDSIIYRTITAICPEMILPPTRYEIRYKYKTIHDSTNLVKYLTKYKYKTIVKYKKIEEKSRFSWTWFFIALLSWIVLGFIVFKKYIKI